MEDPLKWLIGSFVFVLFIAKLINDATKTFWNNKIYVGLKTGTRWSGKPAKVLALIILIALIPAFLSSLLVFYAAIMTLMK